MMKLERGSRVGGSFLGRGEPLEDGTTNDEQKRFREEDGKVQMLMAAWQQRGSRYAACGGGKNES